MPDPKPVKPATDDCAVCRAPTHDLVACIETLQSRLAAERRRADEAMEQNERLGRRLTQCLADFDRVLNDQRRRETWGMMQAIATGLYACEATAYPIDWKHVRRDAENALAAMDSENPTPPEAHDDE